MKLDDLIRTLAIVKESRDLPSDLEVHILTEIDGVQHEQLLGDLVVAIRSQDGDKGIPTKLMLVPAEFEA